MCCSVGVEPHPRTHTPTHTRTPSLCGKAQGLIWGILSVSWSACQVHCVTGDSMTSSQPLQSYASASISLHIYTHTHRHGVVGGGLQFLYDSSSLVWRKSMTGSLHSTRPPTLTHTPLSLLDAEIRLNHYVLPSTPLCLYSGFCFSPVCLPLCPFFCHFTVIRCSVVVLSSAVCPCIALLLPRLSFWIFICVLFSSFLASHSFSSLFLFFSCYSPPLLPYFQAFLSFHRFATLLPPSPTLTSYSFSNSISPLLLQHTKQNFSDYFSSWETLETQVRDPPPLPSAVTMTTATALSFIEEGWKEGGGAGSLLCVVTQR